MAGEFGSGSGLENVPGFLLTQELLSWGVKHERVVELPDFTFLKPYDRYSSQRDRVALLSLPLSSQETLAIGPSDISGNTHRLSLIGIPQDAIGKVYMVGLPYKDTTEADRQAAEIDSQESSEWSERYSERQYARSDDAPQSYMRPYISPFRFTGESIEDYKRRLDEYSEEWQNERDRYNQEWEAYNEREAARDRADQRADERASETYQRMRDRIYLTYEPVIRHSVSFFRGERDEDGREVASIDFQAQVDSGSIFLPYQPLDWVQFNERQLLKLFLEFLEKDKNNFEKWDALFKSQIDQLALAPRLAISAKLQVLGGEVK